MTDLRELLRTTAAEGAEAVDLAEDVVADRIRRRRTHTKHLTVGGVAVAAAAAIAGTTWLVRPAGETPAPASGPVPRIVRSDVDTPAVMEALLGTTLSADANGCVQAGSDPTAVTRSCGHAGTPSMAMRSPSKSSTRRTTSSLAPAYPSTSAAVASTTSSPPGPAKTAQPPPASGG